MEYYHNHPKTKFYSPSTTNDTNIDKNGDHDDYNNNNRNSNYNNISGNSMTLTENTKSELTKVDPESSRTQQLVNKEHRYCISSRGMVNIQTLASLIHEGHNEPIIIDQQQQMTYSKLKSSPIQSLTNLWDPINACQNNIHIVRSSHDAWGIKKIILLFCDDFLQTVYEMPWWYSNPTLQQAIQPILDSLNITTTTNTNYTTRRLVRLLLASLPPGVTIPVHHDTGEWVKYTHRVHVPIIVPDPNLVVFTCGPDESTLKRVPCIPGHVFEMNNQAKHAVSNCHPTNHRVHLILDYIDHNEITTIAATQPLPKRIQLKPGERLLQTRRSIDRYVDKGLRPTPSYLILGAQKSGTTSLYEYMTQHPLIIKAKRRETHCLDWRWKQFDEYTTPTTTLNAQKQKESQFQQQQEHCLSFFHSHELQLHPSCLTGESTPSYLLDSHRCIPRLLHVFPHSTSYQHMKFLVVLRDPIKRANSHYAMVTSLDGTPEQISNRGTEWIQMTLEQVIDLDMRNMKRHGLIPYWDIDMQLMDLDVFREFVGSKEEDEAFRNYLQHCVPMNTGSHSLVSRGMYELQLRQWFQSSFSLKQFLILKFEDMIRNDCLDGNETSTTSENKCFGIQNTLNKVWKHLGLPQYTVTDKEAKNSRSYEPMKKETKEMLGRFYKPHNDRLETLLGQDWVSPWN
jgi:hypothetical protein